MRRATKSVRRKIGWTQGRIQVDQSTSMPPALQIIAGRLIFSNAADSGVGGVGKGINMDNKTADPNFASATRPRDANTAGRGEGTGVVQDRTDGSNNIPGILTVTTDASKKQRSSRSWVCDQKTRNQNRAFEILWTRIFDDEEGRRTRR
jgi:hypothetical protein